MQGPRFNRLMKKMRNIRSSLCFKSINEFIFNFNNRTINQRRQLKLDKLGTVSLNWNPCQLSKKYLFFIFLITKEILFEHVM